MLDMRRLRPCGTTCQANPGIRCTGSDFVISMNRTPVMCWRRRAISPQRRSSRFEPVCIASTQPSKHGPWTFAVLQLIRDNPRRRAPELAALRGLDTAAFKIAVRKLKNLGLTLSFNPGYEISPRGEAYLAMSGD